MKLFALVLPENSGVSAAEVQDAFPRSHAIRDQAWILAGAETCAAVLAKLNIGQDAEAAERPRTGVALLIGDFNGYASATIWELLNQWDAEEPAES